MRRVLWRSCGRFVGTALFVSIALVALAAWASGAELARDRLEGAEPSELEEPPHEERVIVDADPEWGGWDDHSDWWHPGGPRVAVWVDRGAWATYRPGEGLWVYFRVDRPCYVTILDYAPDGRVDVLFPNRWSGSNFVHPGQTYRVPESRAYSLRIAGPGGVETLVACAHEAPWPSGPGGFWIPPFHPCRGRVVVGRPGGHRAPGRPGRVAVGPPGGWPVPRDWRDRGELWGCDSVSFYVDGGCPWWHEPPWQPRLVFHEGFRMSRCSDHFYRDVGYGGEELVVKIECTESEAGDPAEIVGRLIWQDGWGSDSLFRIDACGVHGEPPRRGRVFVSELGPMRVEVEIEDFELEGTNRWRPSRMNWIQFDVRVYED